ncbi:hypothetical protein N7507_009082 [Penicillium longicatenatum]|nr:hypothetical protein N7507_009082 [Penicillium longicatenatum]
MANDRFVYDDDSQPWTPDRWNGPTPGNFGRSSISTSLSPSPHRTLQPIDRLGYLPFDEWEEGEEYDQQPPQYVCYTIKWILRINNKRAGGATVKDLVVAPSEYWDERLTGALEDMLQAKKKKHLRARYESAELTVSVNERNQSDLEQFESTKNIKWKPLEKQLCKWSNLLHIGKKLTIDIVFAYRTDDDAVSTPASRKGDKRGRVSTTRKQLAECDAYIADEEERTGRPSCWDHVYEQMRCRDGGKLDGHDDVPEDIQKDLIAQSQGRTASKKGQGVEMPYHPININVLSSQPGARESSGVATPPQHPATINHPVIPGPGAVRKYCKWLESRATEEAYRADIRKVCQVVLENLMDLELIMGAQNPGFFTTKGIKREQRSVSVVISLSGPAFKGT